MEGETNIAFWRKYFQVYDVLNKVAPYRDMLETVLDSLEASPGDRVLDVGAGTGNWSLLATSAGLEVVSLDFSKEGLDLYRKKDVHANTKEHDLTKPLPYADSTFDHVCVINTVYALPEHTHLSVFRELFRVLRNGGRISIVNLLEGYTPWKIYMGEIKENYKQNGVLRTMAKVVCLIIPTIKMFYYNKKLSRKEGVYTHFFTPKKQYSLLSQVGFSHISDGRFVLAEQAILHTATK